MNKFHVWGFEVSGAAFLWRELASQAEAMAWGRSVAEHSANGVFEVRVGGEAIYRGTGR